MEMETTLVLVFIYIGNVMANYDMTHKCSQNHNFKEYLRIWGNNCDCY